MKISQLAILSVTLAATAAQAQTSYPMINQTHPVAVQRGKTTEVTVSGTMNFAGAYRVLFVNDGIQADILGQAKAAPGKGKRAAQSSLKLKLDVAADSPLGIREFRFASAFGISSVGQLVVVDDPVVMENSANNTRPQAQNITLPCVVAGKLEAVEDVDFFKFEAKAGEPLTFELHCSRLQDRIHDLQKHAKPMLTLYDGEGRELAANDHFYFADPVLQFTPTKTGTYFVQVRESTYDGDARWVYALRATNKPSITHLYPTAGNPGQTIDVEPIGSARAVQPKVKLKVPDTLGVQQVQLDLPGMKTNPATFIVSPLPQVLEQEPNDGVDKATRIAIPAGINGRIGKHRDLDYFVFKAVKGKVVTFELQARRFNTLLNSGVHAVLEILDGKGAVVSSSDVTHGNGQEALLTFTPPRDDDFVLRVRDLNSKGGEQFVYHVAADWAVQDFTLRCDPDKAMLGPGSSTAWYVHVVRKNGFAGPVKIDVKGLPPTMTATPLTIPPSMTQGMMVLTAAPGAGLDCSFVSMVGTAQAKDVAGKDVTLVREVTPNQEIYSPGGGRAYLNITAFAVAVTEPSDILKVKVSTRRIVLKPGEEAKIEVDVERNADYDKGVSLDILHQHLGSVFGNPLPPGVTIVGGKSKTLLGKGSKGFITIKADAKAAPIDDVPISVLAHVSINFVVKISYSSEPILLSVQKK